MGSLLTIMVTVNQLISKTVKGRQDRGVASSAELIGSGAYGIVAAFDTDEGGIGSNLVWLVDDYSASGGLVVKRGMEGVAHSGYDLIRELEVSRHLCHPNVVEVVAMHIPRPESSKQLGLVMPRAMTTLDHIEGDGWEFRTRSALQDVVTALEYVHASGYIHKDLRPANVLIYKDGTTRLADFGVARRESEQPFDFVPNDGRNFAPECLGPNYGRASDLWSFGVMLFELICQGRYLFSKLRGSDRYSVQLMKSIALCPCIRVTVSDLTRLGAGSGDILQEKGPIMPWVEYIDRLGFLDRAVALVGSTDQVEYLLGGLLCVDPSQRLTIEEMRATPMFARTAPAIPPSPRQVWTQRTDRGYVKEGVNEAWNLVSGYSRRRPEELRLLFTANLMYSACVEALAAADTHPDAHYLPIYYTCLQVAAKFRLVDYSRGQLVSNETAKQHCRDMNKIEAFILMTCLGSIDQETAYDRAPKPLSLEQVRQLYFDDFID